LPPTPDCRFASGTTRCSLKIMLRPCLTLWSIFVVPALTLLGVHLSGLSFATPLFVLICVPTLELLLGKEQTVQSGGTQTSLADEPGCKALATYACAHFVVFGCAFRRYCADETDSQTRMSIIISFGIMNSFSLIVAHQHMSSAIRPRAHGSSNSGRRSTQPRAECTTRSSIMACTIHRWPPRQTTVRRDAARQYTPSSSAPPSSGTSTLTESAFKSTATVPPRAR
jgi:hypothetical protein